jgi:uncharacterized membrane protein
VGEVLFEAGRWMYVEGRRMNRTFLNLILIAGIILALIGIGVIVCSTWNQPYNFVILKYVPWQGWAFFVMGFLVSVLSLGERSL